MHTRLGMYQRPAWATNGAGAALCRRHSRLQNGSQLPGPSSATAGSPAPSSTGGELGRGLSSFQLKEQETLNCAYQLHDHTLATVDKVKHLHRVSFQTETIWEVHSNKTCSKANKTLRSLRCNFKISATSTKKTAYKAFARPNLEYATPAWGPPPPPPHTHTEEQTT